MHNLSNTNLIDNLQVVANNLSRKSNSFVIDKNDNIKMTGFITRMISTFKSRKKYHEKLQSTINKQVDFINNLPQQEFIRDNGEVTELFIAAQNYNQAISKISDPKNLALRFVENPSIPDLKIVTQTVGNLISMFAGDQPEIVKEKRFFSNYKIQRYPGDRIDHSKEATSIFTSTQKERLLSVVGRVIEVVSNFFGRSVNQFQKYHYRSHGETDEQIYSNALPITVSKQPTSYWLGHATLLLNLPLKSNNNTTASFNVVTDPIEGDLNKILYPRKTKIARTMEELPATHVYLLSHNHLDHYSKKTIAKLLTQQPVMVVPQGDGERYRNLGFTQVSELNWWETQAIKLEQDGEEYEMQITATPARHWAGQGPCGGHESTFLGYVIQGVEGGDVYFAGDTARLNDDHINKLRENFDIKWNFQPGGPDEVRKDMVSTHRASFGGLWMHFNLMVKKQYFEGMNKKDFINEVSKLKTIYMHTMTFKLGNLHLSDTIDSVNKVKSALRREEIVLKSCEKIVYNELREIKNDFIFANNETLTDDDIVDILNQTVAVPKIGSRTNLNSEFEKESLYQAV